jgi:hypothetical protein
MGSTAATPTDWGTVDTLFRQGDYTEADDEKRLHGLNDWIPTGTPATLLGQARTANREALAGIYLSTGSYSDIEHSLIQGMAKMGDYFGGAPDVILMDYTLWGLLVKELNLQVRRVVRDGKAGVEPITILGPNGPADVVPCTFCQPATAWCLTMSTWKLYSAGPCVGIFDDDGNSILRVSNDDALETRAVSYPQLGCNQPGRNMRIAFS